MLKICFFFIFCLGANALPQLFCQHNQKPNDCFLQNVYLLRDQPRYTPISTLPYNEIESVAFYNQKLAILSQDFCDSFPRLWSFYAASNKIEIVDKNAFASCFRVKFIDISDNQIQVLPAELFRNNFQLISLTLQVNKIGQIADDQFERNVNLQTLFLNLNELQTFPASAIRNCKILDWLILYSNNFYEFDSVTVIANAPKLAFVALNGNMLPCSRIRGMLNHFEEAGILLDDRLQPRSRPFRMTEVDGYTCIDAQ